MLAAPVPAILEVVADDSVPADDDVVGALRHGLENHAEEIRVELLAVDGGVVFHDGDLGLVHHLSLVLGEAELIEDVEKAVVAEEIRDHPAVVARLRIPRHEDHGGAEVAAQHVVDVIVAALREGAEGLGGDGVGVDLHGNAPGADVFHELAREALVDVAAHAVDRVGVEGSAGQLPSAVAGKDAGRLVILHHVAGHLAVEVADQAGLVHVGDAQVVGLRRILVVLLRRFEDVGDHGGIEGGQVGAEEALHGLGDVRSAQGRDLEVLRGLLESGGEFGVLVVEDLGERSEALLHVLLVRPGLHLVDPGSESPREDGGEGNEEEGENEAENPRPVHGLAPSAIPWRSTRRSGSYLLIDYKKAFRACPSPISWDRAFPVRPEKMARGPAKMARGPAKMAEGSEKLVESSRRGSG